MNAPHPLQAIAMQAVVPNAEDRERNLLEYWDIIVDNRWLVIGVTLLALFAGGAFALLARPIYQANLLIQVEDSSHSSALLGSAGPSLDLQTPATGEIEIIRSRMVLGQAVDSTRFDIEASPRYIPYIGSWLARNARSLSEPGFLGIKGYVHGTEKITVASFEPPEALEGTSFSLRAGAGNSYVIVHPQLPTALPGTVGRTRRSGRSKFRSLSCRRSLERSSRWFDARGCSQFKGSRTV
jgi:tyrosine-protein kinase Etk/Wzc